MQTPDIKHIVEPSKKPVVEPPVIQLVDPPGQPLVETNGQAGVEPSGKPSVKSGVKSASGTVLQPVKEASVKPIVTVKPSVGPLVKLVEPTVEGLTVRSLQQLKLELEGEEEARKRVLKGVGQQAYSEFRTLVTNLSASGKQVILDPNVRTLYYTIVNFGRVAVSPAMRRWEPLSNFCLRVAPFLDLESVLVKDGAILATVVRQLGGQEVAAFRARVEQLRRAGGEFVLQDQEENIVLYHKVRHAPRHAPDAHAEPPVAELHHRLPDGPAGAGPLAGSGRLLGHLPTRLQHRRGHAKLPHGHSIQRPGTAKTSPADKSENFRLFSRPGRSQGLLNKHLCN